MARRSFLAGCVAFAFGCGACGSEATEPEATGDDNLTTLAAAKLVMSPGVERLEQHRTWRGDAIPDGQRKSIDVRNAYWLARLSEIAYDNEADAKKKLAAIGLPTDARHFRFFEDKATHSEAFYVTTADLGAPPAPLAGNPWRVASSDVAVLAFRGTEPIWADISTDLAMFPNPHASCAGRIHHGFHTALDGLWDRMGLGAFLQQHHFHDGRVTPTVRRGAELYLTGHSLGGALATLALGRTMTDLNDPVEVCTEVQTRYVPVAGLVTFGAPRVGDSQFAKTLATVMQDRTPIFRFVHGNDMVVTVPSFGFSHVGFDRKEEDYQVALQRRPALMFVSERVPRNGIGPIVDHNLGDYVASLDGILALRAVAPR